ncbi:hypothetical protein Tco_0583453 [Tanacetum coccineum]
MEGWKPKSLKNKSFANIQELFDKAMKKVITFVDYKTELVEESSKKAEAEIAQESSSKRAGDELEQENAKKQKVDEDKETTELQSLIEVVSDDEEEVAIDDGRIVRIKRLLDDLRVTAAKLMLLVYKLLLLVLKVNAASTKVTTAQRLRLLKEFLLFFSTWMAFEGNTRDLGSFGEETDEITDLHQIHEEILFSERGDGVTGIKRRRRDPYSEGVRDLVTASAYGQLNKDLESST